MKLLAAAADLVRSAVQKLSEKLRGQPSKQGRLFFLDSESLLDGSGEELADLAPPPFRGVQPLKPVVDIDPTAPPVVITSRRPLNDLTQAKAPMREAKKRIRDGLRARRTCVDSFKQGQVFTAKEVFEASSGTISSWQAAVACLSYLVKEGLVGKVPGGYRRSNESFLPFDVFCDSSNFCSKEILAAANGKTIHLHQVYTALKSRDRAKVKRIKRFIKSHPEARVVS